MNPFIASVHDYCEANTSLPSPVLYQLERETHLKTLAPQMLSGHLQGQFLHLLVKLSNAKQILEIGTFTGYATICMATGLSHDGAVHTIEANRELVYLIRKYLTLAEVEEKVQLYLGDAKTIIPTIQAEYDIVFIDAGKQDYSFYYDVVFDRVKIGGLILADNVLWSGKVIRGATDKDTLTIKAFNEKVHNDPRVENIMLPIRDGIMMARKIAE